MKQVEYTLNENELFDFFRYLLESRKDILIIKWIMQLSIPVLLLGALFVFKIKNTWLIALAIILTLLWFYVLPKIWYNTLYKKFKNMPKNSALGVEDVVIEFKEGKIIIQVNNKNYKKDTANLKQIINLRTISLFRYDNLLLPVPIKIAKSYMKNFTQNTRKL